MKEGNEVYRESERRERKGGMMESCYNFKQIKELFKKLLKKWPWCFQRSQTHRGVPQALTDWQEMEKPSSSRSCYLTLSGSVGKANYITMGNFPWTFAEFYKGSLFCSESRVLRIASPAVTLALRVGWGCQRSYYEIAYPSRKRLELQEPELKF